ncbi:MAG: c-type cytochrome [Rhodospirillales bacterium]|nr:c-type cytochrome [Rhodospirillales bacterium]
MKGATKRRLLWLTGAAAAIGAAGFLVAWSGIINVGASTGHWAITSWFLHFSMRQSVETHALGIEAPALDDPGMVLRGAGHYATGCAACHGAPGQPQSPVALAMTPPPPVLAETLHKWEPEELFWIVRNGVKMTAMPAWVAFGREDEVWAMVAFLLRLPDMEPAEYRRLAFGRDEAGGDAAGGDGAAAEARTETGSVSPAALTPGTLDEIGGGEALANCARCHGRDGAGRGEGAFPRLTGQSEAYLLASLEAYAAGRRYSGFMQPAAAGLSEEEMLALAAHFADAEAPAVPDPGEPALVARGRDIATQGAPADGVPACAVCHGPLPDGRSVQPHPLYPRLAGQRAGYLEQQLRAWQQDTRGGTPFAHIMRTIAARMSDDQIRAVTLYYQSLAPQPSAAAPGSGG